MPIRCLGACGKTYLISGSGKRLLMPHWNLGADGLPRSCYTCGGRIVTEDTEYTLVVLEETEE